MTSHSDPIRNAAEVTLTREEALRESAYIAGLKRGYNIGLREDSYATNRMERWDGKYNGYVPGLACVAHGGPEMPKHQGDPCTHCGIPHDDVPVGPCAPSPTTDQVRG